MRSSCMFTLLLLQIKQYVVVGRKKPTLADPNPSIFKMKLFSTNTVLAKSRFFYFMSQLKRVKRANGEILSMQEVSNRMISLVVADSLCVSLVSL